ncbi:hypothetical protein AAVH_15352 [Aphelenchoides avenae]|nr:hypothetical protein AAVH_15352 [Aphelenchus avenae]
MLTFALSVGAVAALSRSKRASSCYADGEDHPNGAEFITNNLMHRCTDGKLEVYGCQTDNGRQLSVGEDVLDRNGPKHGPWGTSDVMGVVYRCYDRDGRTAFQQYACGFQNTPPCDLPKVPYTPEEIDAFSRYKPV